MGPGNALFADHAPHHDFLILFDSDGTVFDTVSIKQKECFIPNTIRFWNLQPIEEAARSTAEFVNMYSAHRGLNRFPALLVLFDLLRQHPHVQQLGFDIPPYSALRQWLHEDTKWNHRTLARRIAEHNAPELQLVLEWSQAINEAVAEKVKNVAPFRHVTESLNLCFEHADLVVCSTTTESALHREWQKHGLLPYVRRIAGQETGSKSEIIRSLCSRYYASDCVLMVGDSPVDLQAARENGARFYPVRPDAEEESWRTFVGKIAPAFFAGKYTMDDEHFAVEQFLSVLPVNPPWQPGA
jgi:phosphoglycolate phosphatase-like HAD superfamily hydrolase